MTDKKQLNQEELEEVNGGCGGYEFCGHKEIKLKNVQVGQLVLIVQESGSAWITHGPGVVEYVNADEKKIRIYNSKARVTASYTLGGKANHVVSWDNEDDFHQ